MGQLTKLGYYGISLLCGIVIFFLSASIQAVPASQAFLLRVNSAIGPATADYFHRGLKVAIENKAAFVILQLDTPGGLDKSMREIIQDILASPIPIVSYVAPSGARAASAGTFILYASHFAVMAPGTNIGAASPVMIGDSSNEKNSLKLPENNDHMAQKIMNDAVAYIRSLAQLRGRNANWAVKAVTQAASLSANEALQQGVIDFIAKDQQDLIMALNGRKAIVLGQEITLNTTNIQVVSIEPDWRVKFLAVITDPSVAYILLLIGIYGLFFEFVNPGFVLPGVAGGIALLLALYAFQLLPVSYAGLALILLGIVFLIAESFMPTFGVIGFGGIIAFVVGSILLLDTNFSTFSLNWVLIILMTLINVVFFLWIIGMVLRARRKHVVTGQEELIGSIGSVIEDFNKDGWVRVHSESWKARTHVPLKKDQLIKVIQIKGLLLTVEPYTEDD